MTDEQKIQEAIANVEEICIVDCNRGIYIPQMFARKCFWKDWNYSEKAYETLLAGPNKENHHSLDYWETWSYVYENAWHIDKNGISWFLTQNENADVFMAHYIKVSPDSNRIPDYNGNFGEWYQKMHKLDFAFHPEDNAHQIVKGENGNRVFTKEEADKINGIMEKVYKEIEDPCAIVLRIVSPELTN